MTADEVRVMVAEVGGHVPYDDLLSNMFAAMVDKGIFTASELRYLFGTAVQDSLRRNGR